jgi:hypothetical protein
LAGKLPCGQQLAGRLDDIEARLDGLGRVVLFGVVLGCLWALNDILGQLHEGKDE